MSAPLGLLVLALVVVLNLAIASGQVSPSTDCCASNVSGCPHNYTCCGSSSYCCVLECSIAAEFASQGQAARAGPAVCMASKLNSGTCASGLADLAATGKDSIGANVFGLWDFYTSHCDSNCSPFCRDSGNNCIACSTFKKSLSLQVSCFNKLWGNLGAISLNGLGAYAACSGAASPC